MISARKNVLKDLLPPLSLYIHFPWCIKKCPYCDFNSHVLNARSKTVFPEQAYVDALLRDLQQEISFVQGRKIHSIFFGGGTPSLMSGAAVKKILSAVEKQIGFASDIEITLEANPGTAEQARFKEYREAGVNRLSIGAQSFNDQFLQKLGRIHSAEEILRAVAMAKQAGFGNFNVDVMFALPGQTLGEAMADLQQAIDLSPPHLSWYQLTIEPNTVFYRERPKLPDEDLQFETMQAGHDLLRHCGYEQYETSAFAQPNKQSQHNRNYWEFGDYLGVGAGAHGKVSGFDSHQFFVRRRQKTRLPEHYLKSISPCSEERIISEKDFPGEFAMNALRLIKGVPRSLFAERTGLSFTVIEATVNRLIQEDLLVSDAERLAPTAKGALFLNDVASRFLAH